MKRLCERHGCTNSAAHQAPYCGSPECIDLRAAMVSRARSSRAIRTDREVAPIPSRDEEAARAASATPGTPTPQTPAAGPVLVRSQPTLRSWTDDDLLDLLSMTLAELKTRPGVGRRAIEALDRALGGGTS